MDIILNGEEYEKSNKNQKNKNKEPKGGPYHPLPMRPYR